MVPEASRTATLTHDPRARSATLLTGALCILGTLGFCAAAQAQEAPPKSWKWTEPLKRPLQLHRFQIRAPVELDAAGYAKLFPRPEWAS